MAKSAGMIGKGTIVSYSDTKTGTFAAVAEVFDATPPPVTVGQDVEFTHYGSDADTEEFKPGWKTPGEASFQLNFTAAGYDALVDLVGAEKWWKFLYPDQSFDVFPAYIKSIGKAVPNKDRMTATVTLRTQGAVEYDKTAVGGGG